MAVSPFYFSHFNFQIVIPTKKLINDKSTTKYKASFHEKTKLPIHDCKNGTTE